jgi:tetratricopeptide (TPR) repeat protein
MPDGSTTPPPPALIAPGAKLRAKEVLVPAGDRAKAIQTGGSVEILARFRNVKSNEAVDSNAVRITIKQPQGRDADAFQWLQEHKLIGYLGYITYFRGDNSDFKAFLAKYANTAYGPYAFFGLGETHFHRKEYKEAIEVFERFVERYPKSAVAEDAAFLVAECHRLQQKIVAADRLFRDVIKRYPDTPTADDAQEMLAELAQHPDMLFPNDRRLDVRFTCDSGGSLSWEEVFKRVSQVSGVPLRVAPELRNRSIKSNLSDRSLRPFMHFFTVLKAQWVAEPDGGYRLVPSASPNQKPKKPAQAP